MNYTIFNVEKKSDLELIYEIYEFLKQNKTESAMDFFNRVQTNTNKRWELIQLIQHFIQPEFKDSYDYCLYCEEPRNNKHGAFCDCTCEKLQKEELSLL